MAAVTQISGRFVIEEKRCQTLHPERGPAAAGAGIPIGAQAGLQIDVGCDGTIVEQLMPSVLDAALAEGEAFGFEPQLVVIGADPGLAVPAKSVLAAADA